MIAIYQSAAPTVLRRVRIERGYSVRRLGSLLGCSREAVRRWDYGRAYPHKRFHALLETLLGRNVDALLAADTETAPAEGTDAAERTTIVAAVPAKERAERHA
jgi:transcriptional regulator with XRE-family HTH domain